MWFRMGLRDLEYAYERFRLDRKIIKPYDDEMAMVSRIQGYEAHFFPWTSWILTALGSVGMFFSWGIIAFANLWIYGSIFSWIVVDLVAASFLLLGIFLAVMSFFLRRKYMVVSIDGISLPRVFGDNHNIPWPSIRRITFDVKGLDVVDLIIEHDQQKTKTNLCFYTNIYLAGAKKEIRLVRVLQAYLRFRVYRQDVEPIRQQIKRDRTISHGLPQILAGIVVGIWFLGARGLMYFFGWLIVIPCLAMALPLSFLVLFGVSIYQTRRWNKKIRNAVIACILGIIICCIIIVLMILPLLP
ncbi:MAG: hypothetical protein ACFFCF_09250 [Promethearchaeota archaeon]